MPAAVRKVAISFGMVYIPVALYTAAQERGVRFNQITPDGVRVHQKRVREDSGAEVPSSEICKGYEYAKGRYVVLTDEELERVQSERDRAIQILHFAPAGSIPPVYYDKSWLCAPDGGDKAYELLRRAMMEEQVVGVGQCVLWNRQDMLALIPEENGIRVQTLFYRQQLRTSPFSAPQAQVTEAEMRMGKQLVQAMTRPYQPENYRDEYEEKLLAAIQRKIDGQEITAAAEPARNVIDLMEALQKSLEMQAGRREPALAGAV